MKNTITKKQSIGQLAAGAFFFAICSCEYLKLPSSEHRRTKVVTLKNIRFFKNGRESQHTDANLPLA